jgi:predicted ATPase
MLAVALWNLGYPEQAMAQMRLALAQAKEVAHPFTLAHQIAGCAWFHILRRELESTRRFAEEGLALSQEQGFLAIEISCRLYASWVLAQQGQAESALLQMQNALAIQPGDSYVPGGEGYVMMLADAYGKAGQPTEGVALLDRALAQVEATGERLGEVEVRRVKGELLQMLKADSTEVEATFLQALAAARQQGAKSLELRVALSLCRLWQEQGRLVEALELLSVIYDWFTEGFDTPDLRRAEEVLSTLSL